MQYESFITSGKKVMANANVFVHAFNGDANIDADRDTRAMTLAPGHSSRLAEKGSISVHPIFSYDLDHFDLKDQ